MYQDSVSCFSISDGSASVIVIGGNGIYTYLWSDGQTSATATNLSAGIYSVTITDQKGCLNDTTIEVLQPDNISVGIFKFDYYLKFK